MAKQLEKGKLYQVRVPRKGWVIAEYHAFVPAQQVSGYRSTDGARTWHEPAKHYWNNVRGWMEYILFDKEMQVRAVTEETIAEIQRLRAAIKQKNEEKQQLIKELLALCE